MRVKEKYTRLRNDWHLELTPRLTETAGMSDAPPVGMHTDPDIYRYYGCHSFAVAITTTQLEKDVRDRLKRLGKKGETFNDIVRRVLRKAEYVEFIEEQYAILDKERNWVRLDDL